MAESTSIKHDKLDDLSPLSDISDSDVDMDDVLGQPTSGATVFSIDTGFDPLRTQNLKVNFRNKNNNERYEETEKERRHAENAETTTSLLDLSSKVILPYLVIFIQSDYQ